MAHCQDLLDALQAACDEKATALVAALQCEAEHNGFAAGPNVTMTELYTAACGSLTPQEQHEALTDVSWYCSMYGYKPRPEHRRG